VNDAGTINQRVGAVDIARAVYIRRECKDALTSPDILVPIPQRAMNLEFGRPATAAAPTR